MKNPVVGEKFYVPSSLHVYRGMDDFAGGIAIISKIEYSDKLPKSSINYIMVGIEARKGTMYNYRILMEKQEQLKKYYGGQIAHADPDDREEFNCSPDADWE